MGMRFEFVVSVEAERTQGKFATRDEIRDAIQEALDGADIGQFTGSEGGEYDITWEVDEQEIEKIRRRKPNPRLAINKDNLTVSGQENARA